MLFLLLIQFINFMNIKFQKYQEYFSQPERIRRKRETNETKSTITYNSEQSTNTVRLEGYQKTSTIIKEQKIIFHNKSRNVANKTETLGPLPVVTPINNHVESFSFYLSKDRRIDKGPKTEINSYSQASFGQIGIANPKQGHFYSDSGGIFMVSATFHVKTEILVVPGHKKKQKKKSFKNNKVQLKLQICSNGKCKSTSEIQSVQALNNFKKIKTNKNSIGSITLLTGQGMVQTCTCSGLLQVAKGEHVSVFVQVTGHVFLLAGSHFSGVMIG